MQLLEHFKELTLHPKNAEELKGLILQLAVQGNLTQKWREENPDVEPASVLLDNIRKEKIRLILERKLKKEDELDKIEADELIKDLPESWKCCRLGEVIEIIRGITFPSSEKSKTDEEGKIPCLRTANVQDKIEWEDLLYIDRSYVKRDDQIIKKGDVIMSMANSRELVGKVALIEFEPNRDFTLGGFISALRTFGFDPTFLMVLLRSPKTRSELISTSSQTTNIANVSISKLRPLVIPFPPLPEQKAIVEVVNQLFAEVEQLEALTKERVQLKEDFVNSALNQLTQAAESEVANHWELIKSQFGTFFTEKTNIKKLREAILQLAVQGKLTHHSRAETKQKGVEVEPAYVLLEKIKAEKEQLIKAGKIKKEKPLPPITEDEIPYDLPEGWVWCRFQEIFDIRDGTHDSPKDAFGKDTFPLITSKNFNSGVIDFESARRISKEDYLKVIQRSQVHKGDILFSMIGGNIGNQVEVGDFTEYAIKNVALFKHYKYGLPKEGFLNLFSKYIALSLQEEAAGGAQPFVSLKYFRNLVLGLPPEQEQKAIIEKVNGLMALCDQLEQEIETHHTTQEHWMQSCLRELV